MRPEPATPEERLRAALLARADEVETSPDALPRIRMRTTRARRRGRWAMIGAAAAVATAIAAGAVAATLPDRRPDRGPAPAASASLAPGPSAAPALKLPVYFAHDGRLFREFRPVALGEDSDRARIRAAVELSLAGRAADPDYTTLWPAGVTVRDVGIDGATVTVDLAGVGGAPSDLAVQQLVYTVSAVSTYTSIRKADAVRLPGVRDGALHQAAMSAVQAPVWVIEPAQGDVVGKTFTLYLAGTTAGATVHARILDATGAVRDERDVTLAGREARVAVTLPAGRYTVEAGGDDHDFAVG